MHSRFVFVLSVCLLAAIPVSELAEQQTLDLPGTHSARVGDLEFRDAVLVDDVPVLRIIRWHGSKATLVHEVRPADVPVLDDDCEELCSDRSSRRYRCGGKCVFGGVGTLTFAPSTGTVFLFANTSTGNNFTRVVLALDVESGRLRRVGITFGAGFNDARTSTDGRYLSYRMYSKRGAMDGSWMLDVMDTQTGDVVSLTDRERRSRKLDSETLVDVKGYAWTGASTITFKAEIRRAKADPDDLIEPTEHFERTEDLAKLFAAGEGKSGRE